MDEDTAFKMMLVPAILSFAIIIGYGIYSVFMFSTTGGIILMSIIVWIVVWGCIMVYARNKKWKRRHVLMR